MEFLSTRIESFFSVRNEGIEKKYEMRVQVNFIMHLEAMKEKVHVFMKRVYMIHDPPSST